MTPATENRKTPPTTGELKRWGIIGLAGLIGSAVLIKGAQIAWRKLVERRAWAAMTKPGSPEQVAERLDAGINPDTPFGLGTNEELIRNTILKNIPHMDFWREVGSAYRKLPGNAGRVLMQDLHSDLSSTEWDELKAILDRKPKNAREAAARGEGFWEEADIKAWTRRIRAAVQYELNWLWPRGTDEEAIYAVFREIPTRRALDRLNEHYRSTYGPSLVEELQSDLDSEEQEKVLEIIRQKPL